VSMPNNSCNCGETVASVNESLRSFLRGRSAWDTADLAQYERLRQRWVRAATHPHRIPACTCGTEG
jgi:hypothetical protein